MKSPLLPPATNVIWDGETMRSVSGRALTRTFG